MDEQINSLIQRAIDNLRRGEVADALLVLERLIDPKFRSFEHALGAYLMRNASAPKSEINDYSSDALGHQVIS